MSEEEVKYYTYKHIVNGKEYEYKKKYVKKNGKRGRKKTFRAQLASRLPELSEDQCKQILDDYFNFSNEFNKFE